MSTNVSGVSLTQYQQPSLQNERGLGSEALKTAKKVGLVFAYGITLLIKLVATVLNVVTLGPFDAKHIDDFFDPATNKIEALLSED